MKTMVLDVPMLAFIVSTRAALAAGVGLLVAERLPADRRRALGAALIAAGAATTIPAVISVLHGIRRSARQRLQPGVEIDTRLIGASRFPRKGDDGVEHSDR